MTVQVSLLLASELRIMALIEDFRKQSRETILDYLDRLGVNRAVFSTHLKGYEPYLKEKNIFIYIHDVSMVVVCFDLSGTKEEIADEGEWDDVNPPCYFTDTSSRISPVWRLCDAMERMELETMFTFPPMEIYGVLLMESTILNAQDMENLWESKNIKVFDGIDGLRHRKITTNEVNNPIARNIMEAILREQSDSMKEDSIEAEYERILKKFLENNKDEENCPVPDVEGDDEEIKPDDFPEGSVHVIEDFSIPDGKIEQNDKISVKVEILRPIANPREELDKLVGCADIKQRMDELVALTGYNKLMSKTFPNSKQHEVSLHSVFLGRPGTGKTTVCKIFGSLLRQAGALSKGHVVVCDRGTFIGTLWGDEERSMRQVLEMAQGGVLMVDEAYLLNGKHEGDPGKLVVQLMMNILADETQRDIAIVLCGYKEPMEKLLESNPGLQSRFPNKFEFADFTIDELLEITRRRVKEYEYEFTPEAWDKYRQLLTKAYGQRDPQTWGNARFVANQLERIYIQHATRCVKLCPSDKQQLRLLTPEDILPMEQPKTRKHIGF